MPGALLETRIDRKWFAVPGRPRDPVLHDVAFSAAPGEVLALFGPSGVGKSTLLRIVLGLDADFAGCVRRPQGHAGVMFQDPRLAPWLTVAENLRLVAPHASADAVGLVLDEVGLPGHEASRPRALSLGMARRVSLARALITAPRWLVLDEPFASLDPGLAAMLAGVLEGYARRARAIVLLATHELDQALLIADRVLVLAGRPATLAVDLPVRADGSVAVRRELLSRFAFLDGAAVPRLSQPAEGYLP